MKILFFIFAALAGAIYYQFIRLDSSRPIPDIKKWTVSDKLYILFKIFRPLVKAEKGKGIELFFASQDLLFTKPEGFKKIAGATIGAGGDIMHCPGFSRQSLSTVWDEIGPFLFSNDIILANLETPVDTSKPPVPIPRGDKISEWLATKAPLLNGSIDAIESFYDSGGRIDIISTASNHSLNMGIDSLFHTLDLLDCKGIVHVGTSRSPQEQDAIPVIEINGIKIAFIAYTFSLNENSLEPGKEYLVNFVLLNEPDADISLVKKHIAIARGKGADIILASLHWGHDLEAYPVQNIINRSHELCDAGIDIILGHHPHMLQPMEKYTSKKSEHEIDRICFIAYSLSEILSFLFFMPVSWLSGVIKIELTKGTINNRTITIISDVKFLPFYKLYRRNSDGSENFYQIDLKKAVSRLGEYTDKYNLTEKDIETMKKLNKLLDTVILPSDSSSILFSPDYEG